MKAIHYRASLLLAGFLQGFNLIPSADGVNNLSKKMGSLTLCKEVDQGLEADAESLAGDWNNVRADLMDAFDATTKPELPQESSKV